MTRLWRRNSTECLPFPFPCLYHIVLHNLMMFSSSSSYSQHPPSKNRINGHNQYSYDKYLRVCALRIYAESSHSRMTRSTISLYSVRPKFSDVSPLLCIYEKSVTHNGKRIAITYRDTQRNYGVVIDREPASNAACPSLHHDHQ